MKFVYLFIFYTLLLFNTSTAQTLKAFEKAGNKAMQQKDYSSAMEYFANALEIAPKRTNLAYKYAEVARQFHAFEIAEQYYNRVVGTDKKNEFPLAVFYLADVKKSIGKYEEAKTFYEQYLQQKNITKKLQIKARDEILSCEWALEVLADPEDIEIQQLNKRINTPYSEFGALQKGDTLFYSSLRYDNKEDTHQPPRKVTKVLQSVKGAKGRTLPRGFNKKTQHTAHTSFSRNGKRIYFTLCDYKNETQIRCDIYYREKDKKGRWAKPVKLPKSINPKEYSNTQPNLAFNTKTGNEFLLFVSDRPGGKGKNDIWKCNVLEDGTFSEPVNLESINTVEEDITPFFYSPAQTLFFSSTGYQTLGGYDVFKSYKNGKEWSKVEHTGYPLNSSYNDVYFSLAEDSTFAYVSSNRLGSMYLDKKNKSCCNDIYKIKFKEIKKEKEEKVEIDSLIVTVSDPIPTKETEIVTNKIPPVKPIPTSLEDFLPLALYFDNDEPDKRTRRTSTKKTYGESFEKYYTLKSVYKKEYIAPLSSEEKLIAEQNMEDFFEDHVKKGNDFLFRFSEILLTRLNQGETVEIFIRGYTSPRAQSDYNLSLGKRRISSLRNHFQKYAGGVFEYFLQKNQLIITERSFGETTANTNISDDLSDLRNSVYSIGAAKERRVELLEIKRH